MAVQLQFTPQYAFAAGVFESGAQARFYESGTTTPETVYSDEALSTAHPSPLVADANGQFATVWGADGVNVKVVVTKADDGALFTLDKVVLGNTAIGNAASVSFSPTTENPATNVQAAILVNTTYNELETTVGRSVTRAADAAAQRTTLGLGSAALMVDSADADLAVDPDGAARRDIVAAAIAAGAVITKTYASSGQTITNGGLLTLSHGMGLEPKITQYVLQCTTAEHGFSIGDRINVSSYTSGADTPRPMKVRVTTTQIRIRFVNETSGFQIGHKSTGASQPINNSRWQLYVRAFA